MSSTVFETPGYIFLYHRYFLRPRFCLQTNYENMVLTTPYPVSISNPYLIMKSTFKPTGIVYPFENNIICIPSKINFGLLYRTRTRKVIIWNTYKFNSLKVKQIQSTDANVLIDIEQNEVIKPNFLVEKTIVAKPTGKTLMVGDYFEIQWEVI